MGIDFHASGYKCSARWSYSGFGEFRKKLARTVNINLEEMTGFRKKHPTDEGFIKPGWRSWDDIRTPLKHLLNASDSEGSLTSEQCEWVYPILYQIFELWEVVDGDDYDNIHGPHLAAAMHYCADNKKKLTWS